MQHSYLQHLLNEAHSHMFVVIGGIAAVLALLILALYFGYRKWRLANERLISRSSFQIPLLHRIRGRVSGKTAGPVENKNSRETIFVVPDISGYAKFVTANQKSADLAQDVVFELLNAIVAASGGRLQLAKIEGDAVFFFDDLCKNSPKELGEVLIAMFARFYEERQRLAAKFRPLLAPCQSIEDLDLKIFVHSGSVSHFRFRDIPDVFGADVVVLYRLMKNNLTTRRYLLVTDAVENRVKLPNAFRSERLTHKIEGFGDIAANVFRFDPDKIITLSRRRKTSWFSAITNRRKSLGFVNRCLNFSILLRAFLSGGDKPHIGAASHEQVNSRDVAQGLSFNPPSCAQE